MFIKVTTTDGNRFLLNTDSIYAVTTKKDVTCIWVGLPDIGKIRYEVKESFAEIEEILMISNI